MKRLSLITLLLAFAFATPASALAHGTSGHGGHAHVPVKWQRGGQSVVPRDQLVLGAIRMAAEQSSRMSYSQSGSRGDIPVGRVPLATDCSGFATWALRSAGVDVPLSTSYTFAVEGIGVPADPRVMHVGDIVVYDGHVEVYIGGGRTAGHGSPGLHYHAFNYRPVVAVRRFFA